MKSEGSSAAERIEQHGIRTTPVRELIFRAIDGASAPVSSLEIEQILETVDRSSITRTLSLFAEKGLVHLIDDGSGSTKYEACPSPHHHDSSDMHVHFHCRSCGKTVCLPDTPIPAVALPEGYIADSATYLVTGLCPACARK